MGIVFSLIGILFTCLFIWRACDGFETASEYLGRNMSEGVRGGTINAISSSIPELLTTIIGLLVLNNSEGFSMGIGTTAGSALFNGMIIPEVCIFAVVGSTIKGRNVETVWIRRKVILRDGLSLIFCELVLVWAVSGTSLYWWQGLLLMSLYFAYFLYMVLSMKKHNGDGDALNIDDEDNDDEEESEMGAAARVFYWLSLGPVLDLESHIIKKKHEAQIKNFTWNAWPLLLSATSVIGLSCYILVVACEHLGAASYTFMGLELQGLGMPVMFVAVIFASMATSVPDTVISIRDARDGDYDDAVANALGSNIFDICFALGFPLFVYTLIYGPIHMSPEVVEQSGELRFLLLILTVVGFCIYYYGRHKKDENGFTVVGMGRPKAVMLLAIYSFFVAFVVSKTSEPWAMKLSELISVVVEKFPSL
jgi:Ca2+/Na+ antiporter